MLGVSALLILFAHLVRRRNMEPQSLPRELRFTLQAALALTEHLSHRLRTVIREDLPSLNTCRWPMW